MWASASVRLRFLFLSYILIFVIKPAVFRLLFIYGVNWKGLFRPCRLYRPPRFSGRPARGSASSDNHRRLCFGSRNDNGGTPQQGKVYFTLLHSHPVRTGRIRCLLLSVLPFSQGRFRVRRHRPLTTTVSTAVTGPCNLEFPADHGPHPGTAPERWYFTGNLPVGIRPPLRFLSSPSSAEQITAPGADKHWPEPSSAWRTKPGLPGSRGSDGCFLLAASIIRNAYPGEPSNLPAHGQRVSNPHLPGSDLVSRTEWRRNSSPGRRTEDFSCSLSLIPSKAARPFTVKEDTAAKGHLPVRQSATLRSPALPLRVSCPRKRDPSSSGHAGWTMNSHRPRWIRILPAGTGSASSFETARNS